MKYLGENQIGDKGCLRLSKTYWPYLQEINLGKKLVNISGLNEVSAEGCAHLSRVHWPNLQEIYLGKEV